MRLSFIVDLVDAQKSKLVGVPVSQLLEMALCLQGDRSYGACLQASNQNLACLLPSCKVVSMRHFGGVCGNVSKQARATMYTCSYRILQATS